MCEGSWAAFESKDVVVHLLRKNCVEVAGRQYSHFQWFALFFALFIGKINGIAFSILPSSQLFSQRVKGKTTLSKFV
jgi:hypothetical protein